VSDNFINLIASGGAPVIVVFLFIAISGAREVPLWVFGAQHRRSLAEKDAAYVARLVEKDEECERERARAKVYEQYTLRLLEAARAATSVATDAIAKRVDS
jgi:hypothetical protein